MTHADDLLGRLEALKTVNSVFKAMVIERRRMYSMDWKNDVVPPLMQDRLEPVLPPTARRAIDEGVDHILYTPRIKVPRRPVDEESTREQNIAEKKRSFLSAWWAQQGLAYNVLGDGRKPLLSEGRICVRHGVDWARIPNIDDFDNRAAYRRELDKLGREGFLWTEQLLPNESVYEDPANHRDPRYVYVQYDILRDQAQALFPGSKAASVVKGDPFETVTYTEYWSYDRIKQTGEFVQWVENNVVKSGKNPYTYVPIAIDDSGFGQIHLGAKPEQKFVGMTQFMDSIFVAEARQMTSMEAVAEMGAFPMIKRYNTDPSKELKTGPGEIQDLEGAKGGEDSEEIEFLQFPEIPIMVLQTMAKTTEIANGVLKMDTLGGVAIPGVETASESQANLRNAAAKLGGPVAALQRIARKISSWVLIDVEKTLAAPVTLYSTLADDPAEIRLQPREIRGFYDVGIELETTDAEATAMNRARFWMDATRLAPFLSYTTAMERGNLSDTPQMEMQKRASEDVFLSDQFRQMRVLEAAQALAKFNELVESKVLEREGGGPATPGGPDSALTATDGRSEALQAAQDLRDINNKGAQGG